MKFQRALPKKKKQRKIHLICCTHSTQRNSHFCNYHFYSFYALFTELHRRKREVDLNLYSQLMSTWLSFHILSRMQRQRFVRHLSGKKSKSVFDLLTYSRETGFSFSHGKVRDLLRLIRASNEIYRVSKSDNFLLFGAKPNALRQLFSCYEFLKIYLWKI